ncbi:MAG: hypothetical protein KatS3mg076_2894 [Candidatus Binatia bacterium]|nr:MAG: hypothetical protein KatS3mg076_2894 [Candidatus Binatia bacterium]
MDRRFRPVQVPDEFLDPAVVEELVRLAGALIENLDPDTAVEERELAEPLREDVEAEGRVRENQGVGLEGHLGAVLVGLADDLEGTQRLPSLVTLDVDVTLALDLDLEVLREGVHDRESHSVEAAGHLVGLAVEFPPGVQLREHHLRRRHPFLGVRVHRDAAPVVLHAHASVEVKGDPDPVTCPGERLVDGVVHHFENEMVETPLGSVADVHAGPLSNGLEPLEDTDVGSVVVVVPSLFQPHQASVGRHPRGTANNYEAYQRGVRQ